MKGECKVTTRINQIHEDLTKLDGSVLSIYLNTNPASEDWKIRLKNGLKKTEEYISASNPEQVKQFAKLKRKVDAMIKDNQRNMTNSLICFASADDIFMYHLQIPVENDFQWQESAATDQLNKLFDEYSRSGVLLLQRDQITLITSSLGEFVNEKSFELDIDLESWKQYKGLAFGGIISSGANHRHKFESRLRENQARWYRDIIPTIEKHARQEDWKSVHLAGPAELTKVMKDLLRLKVTGETTRNYSGKSAHDILDRTILAAQ